MERIIYRITLDTHKTGVQRTLQGFQTADNMARRIAISLVSCGDSFEIDETNTVAMMYVTTPNATEPSINACTIEDNTIIYDVLPIVEEGITEMQIKLISTSTNGAKRVLATSKFAVEVTESGTDDSDAEQTATFTALENAVAIAHGVYNERLLRVEITADCTFKAYYADGTVYENGFIKDAIYNGNAVVAESYAVGGTGTRKGEDTDNAKYYSNVSRSASADVNDVAEEARDLLDEARLQTAYTVFNVDFETGELVYASANYNFNINEETGELEAESEGDYSPEELIGGIVDDYINEKTVDIDAKIERVNEDISATDANVSSLAEKADELEAEIDKNANAITRLNSDMPYHGTISTNIDGASIMFGRYTVINNILIATARIELSKNFAEGAKVAQLDNYNFKKGAWILYDNNVFHITADGAIVRDGSEWTSGVYVMQGVGTMR